MTLLAVLVVGLLVYALGRVLVRRLGWPTDLAAAGRWGLLLLGLAVLMNGLPALVDHVAARLGPLPPVPAAEIVTVLAFLGLAALGYVAWTRGEAERRRRHEDTERARFLPRRSALPPAPRGPAAEGGFRPAARPRTIEPDRGSDE